MSDRHQEAPMPVVTNNNDVVGRVMADHDIRLYRLEAETGFDHSFLSRVLDGQYSVPPEVLRCLWRLTRDPRILTIALGDGEHVATVVHSHWRQESAKQVATEAMGRLAIAMRQVANIAAGGASLPLKHADLQYAMDALAALQIVRLDEAQGPAPARPTIDTAA